MEHWSLSFSFPERKQLLENNSILDLLLQYIKLGSLCGRKASDSLYVLDQEHFFSVWPNLWQSHLKEGQFILPRSWRWYSPSRYGSTAAGGFNARGADGGAPYFLHHCRTDSRDRTGSRMPTHLTVCIQEIYFSQWALNLHKLHSL